MSLKNNLDQKIFRQEINLANTHLEAAREFDFLLQDKNIVKQYGFYLMLALEAHLRVCIGILYKILDSSGGNRDFTLRKFLLENQLNNKYGTRLNDLQSEFKNKGYKNFRDQFHAHIDRTNLDYDPFPLLHEKYLADNELPALVKELQDLIFEIDEETSGAKPGIRTLGPIAQQIRKLFK